MELTRDSVCLADDVDAPHSLQLTVAGEADLRGVLAQVAASGWVPHVGSTATWSVEVGGEIAVFGERMGVPFVEIAGGHGVRARAMQALKLTYHQQQPHEAVLANLVRRRAAIDGAVKALLAVLGALAPPDSEQGAEAARIITHIRARNASPQAVESSLSYAVGGKGLFDWSWSPVSLAKLEQAAMDVRSALQVRPGATPPDLIR